MAIRIICMAGCALCLAGCRQGSPATGRPAAAATSIPYTPPVSFGDSLARAAAALTLGPYVAYNAAYVSIAYPMGDVPARQGVCADVVIRAYRKMGIDLQQRVHEDMRANFQVYPKKWGLRAPDTHIDHRRVPNLARFFERKGATLATGTNPAAYAAGDVVVWALQGNRPHIGIVIAEKGAGGAPLVVHHIGNGVEKSDVLFRWPITGHFRFGDSLPLLPASACLP